MPHPIRCEIAGSELGDLDFHGGLYRAVHHHAEVCISVLLQRALRKLLSTIQDHVNCPNRDDWLPICFAISLLFLGAESLQVDIYLNGTEPLKMIRAMEDNAVKSLVKAFVDSTSRVNPLTIDWNDNRNAELVGSDADLVYAFQDLQNLRDEYCEFIILYNYWTSC